MDPRNLVFLDEFGANLGLVPRYGRSRSGRRLHINKPRERGRNITFAGAMTLEGVLGLVALPGSATIVHFAQWVKDVLAPALKPGQIVIMDNLRAHHAEEVRELIEATGATIMFLPPYSPDFNPIELCWSKVKNILRKMCARSEAALLAAVEIARNTVTAENISGWFAHAGYAMAQHA